MFAPLFRPAVRSMSPCGAGLSGFGHSDWLIPKFAYTFDHYAEIMNQFTEAFGLSRSNMKITVGR
jgi:hypothetical protein